MLLSVVQELSSCFPVLESSACMNFEALPVKYYKAITRGQTDHFSNILTDRIITQLLLHTYSFKFIYYTCLAVYSFFVIVFNFIVFHLCICYIYIVA